MRNKILHTLKIVISVALLLFLFIKVDWKSFLHSLQNSNLFFIFISFLISFLIVWLMSLKWNLLLRVNNYSIATFTLMKITMITSFIGLFLPSSISTDVLRGYYLTKEKSSKLLSASSIIVDRLSGISSLLFMIFLGLFLSENIFDELNLKPILYSLIFVLLISIIVLFNRGIKNKIDLVFEKSNNVVIKNLKKIYLAVNDFRKYPKTVLITFLLSIIVQLLRGIRFYLIALAFNIEISIVYFIIIVPIIMLAIMLPISLGGLGVKEGIAVAFLQLIGIAFNNAITIALVESITMTIVILIGGVLYIFYKPSSEINIVNNKL